MSGLYLRWRVRLYHWIAVGSRLDMVSVYQRHGTCCYRHPILLSTTLTCASCSGSAALLGSTAQG
jgi:hypothetical protein